MTYPTRFGVFIIWTLMVGFTLFNIGYCSRIVEATL